MIDVIAFDADDTLWHNEHLYSQAKAYFQEALAPYVDGRTALAHLDAVEEHNVRIYGYGIKSFTLSMVEAALALADGQPAGQLAAAALQIGRQMMDAELPFLDHAETTLAELSAGYPLMLITKGDTFEQQRKIERSGLARYFRYIEIVADKTPTTYHRLFTQHDFDPCGVLMVGNSLRSDILPVLDIGGQAAYIHYENTWAHEHVDEATCERYRFFQLAHLGELPALVRQLNGA
ncbi:MAG: HAD family hydrolase [Chloroflexota bacterium]